MTISVRMGLAPRIASGAADTSVRAVAEGLRLEWPITLGEIVDLLEPVGISFKLEAGSCSVVGEITLASSGLCRYAARVRNSGALAVSYTTITAIQTVVAPHYRQPVLMHQGHVGGTLSFDAREDTWDKSSNWPLIADNWAAIKAAPPATTKFGINSGSIDFLDAFANAATGTWIFSI